MNKTKKHVPFIIVGQGIAGTMLAWELLRRDIDFVIVDPHSDLSASAVSSGIINPITGRRYVKSWLIDDLLPTALETYENIGSFLDCKVIWPVKIARSLPSIKEQNNWYLQSARSGYSAFMAAEYQGPDYSKVLHGVSTFGMVKGGLRVDTTSLLRRFREKLSNSARLLDTNFDYESNHLAHGKIYYGGISADQIIFAEGWMGINNPFFNHLAFQPAQGVVLLCHIPDFPESCIVKHKKFFVPLGDQHFWVGSTYSWNLDSRSSEKKGRTELEDYLRHTLKVPYEIYDVLSGIRPATKYRRPFVGTHPEYDNVHILNGLGTKGISMAPYLAKVLIYNIIDAKGPENSLIISELPSLDLPR